MFSFCNNRSEKCTNATKMPFCLCSHSLKSKQILLQHCSRWNEKRWIVVFVERYHSTEFNKLVHQCIWKIELQISQLQSLLLSGSLKSEESKSSKSSKYFKKFPMPQKSKPWYSLSLFGGKKKVERWFNCALSTENMNFKQDLHEAHLYTGV